MGDTEGSLHSVSYKNLKLQGREAYKYISKADLKLNLIIKLHHNNHTLVFSILSAKFLVSLITTQYIDEY